MNSDLMLKRTALSQASARKGEKNDCAVMALAVVAGVDYDIAHEKMKEFGRKDRDGTPNVITRRALQDFGLTCVSIKELTNGRTVKTLKTWLERNLPRRKALIVTSGHICAWDGEHVVDWAADRLLRVVDVLLVGPK